MDTKEIEKQAWKESAGFIIAVSLILLVFALCAGCSLLTSEQKEQIKEQINKPENQEKVIEQINEVLK